MQRSVEGRKLFFNESLDNFKPRWNIRPGQMNPVVISQSLPWAHDEETHSKETSQNQQDECG